MRPSTLVATKLVAILAFGGGCLFLALQPHPIGPVTQTFDCRWDEDSYQSVIVYRDRHGREIGQSAGAGDCTP